MIISRTPCRMSFVGGGTDLPSHYLNHGGAVVSTSIDKYINICVSKRFGDQIRASYSVTEICDSVDDLEHPLIREGLRMTGIKEGIEIVSLADIPAAGTGLGSSSSFTVGLLNALFTFIGQKPTRHQLGRDACRIEIDICKEPIGKQDQYAAAFGGMNFIRFNKDNTVDVEPLDFHEHIRDRVESCILPFYTGIVRSASSLLAEQSRIIETGEKYKTMCRLTELAYELRDQLRKGNADAIGHLMDEGWELKKTIASNISSNDIDRWYTAGRNAGAIGGKLLGAGAGGFLVFYAPPEKHDAIRAALPELNYVRFGLDRDGAKIIFRDDYNHDRRP